MLCDVISAVAEFMVRVLYLRSAVRIHDVVGLRPALRVIQCHAPRVVVSDSVV
jgi:hypothetical protein